jgi:hypothetical protein
LADSGQEDLETNVGSDAGLVPEYEFMPASLSASRAVKNLGVRVEETF